MNNVEDAYLVIHSEMHFLSYVLDAFVKRIGHTRAWHHFFFGREKIWSFFTKWPISFHGRVFKKGDRESIEDWGVGLFLSETDCHMRIWTYICHEMTPEYCVFMILSIFVITLVHNLILLPNWYLWLINLLMFVIHKKYLASFLPIFVIDYSALSCIIRKFSV